MAVGSSQLWVTVTMATLFLMTIGRASGQQVTDVLKRHLELTEFLKLLESSSLLLKTLEIREGTLFVPTDNAIKAFAGKIDNYTLLYHFSNVAKKAEDLDDLITSELPGNPSIYVTKRNSDVYLNDAKIGSKKDILAKNSNGQNQYIHSIDRVLEPTFPYSMDSNLYNPDAGRFLERSSEFNITGTHFVTNFAQQVGHLKKQNIFRNSGRHTFFIPVDEAFKRITIKSVDAKVIEGHVIPNQVIFLRSAENGKEFETAALASSLPVFVSIDKENVNSNEQWIVKSDTRTSGGDAFHRKGVVQTEIIKGNIPLKNGVAHLISKPLVLIDSTVYQILEGTFSPGGDGEGEKGDKSGGPCQEFFKLIHDYASDELKGVIQNTNREGITVFVPTNEALQKPQLELLKANRTQLEEIIRLHIVLKTVSSENITGGSGNEREPYQIQSFNYHKKLFFNVERDSNGENQLYVEGGGVNATITQPDIGATNGVIHMIDRVLGISDQTIYEKLQTDPMLQNTFKLTSQENFNLQFKDPHKRFTLFAPSNLAWEKIYKIAPSEYKKLFMGVYGYHVGKIMERHIMMNQVFRIEELRQLSKNATRLYPYPIPAIHGFLRVNHREDIDWVKNYKDRESNSYAVNDNGLPFSYDYAVYWNYQRAQVIRPNIECVNGIIHIIDNVLMRPSDVTVASAETKTFQILLLLLPVTAILNPFF